MNKIALILLIIVSFAAAKTLPSDGKKRDPELVHPESEAVAEKKDWKSFGESDDDDLYGEDKRRYMRFGYKRHLDGEEDHDDKRRWMKFGDNKRKMDYYGKRSDDEKRKMEYYGKRGRPGYFGKRHRHNYLGKKSVAESEEKRHRHVYLKKARPSYFGKRDEVEEKRHRHAYMGAKS